MGSILEAENALANLNDEPILKDGSKMNIYFSNLSEVSFQNNNSGGVGKILKNITILY